MAVPTLVSNYPSDGDTGIPVGATILCYFSVGVDLESIKNSIVLFGRDFDQTSGPDQSLWIDNDTGNNKYWLSSPGFKGTVPLNFELVYFDNADPDLAVDENAAYTSQADETTDGFGHLVRITPQTGSLAPETVYTLYVNADTESNNLIGVSARTVFDVAPDAGNTGTTGSLSVFGTWAGTSDDVVNVKITTAGEIGVAKYKWWYTSLGEGSATTGRLTSRRFRKLEHGLQIRFTGSAFEDDDLYTFNVYATARLATSSSLSFTTNDGSFETAPASPSTPAVSSPPSTVLPSVSDAEAVLSILSMTPEHGSYNNPNSTRVITIVFDDDIDEDTITDETVKIYAYPASGHYGDTTPVRELSKELIVEDDTLTIRF
jgi:hypothetical protein